MATIPRTHPSKGPARATWLRVADVARLLGMSANTVRRWTDAGKIPAHRSPGGHRRYLLDEIVTPVVDRYYREHPEERRFVGKVAGLDELLSELKMIRDLLTSGKPLYDIQLFSQLRNLNEIKGALQAQDNETARRMVSQVDQLLESIFSSSKFA